MYILILWYVKVFHLRQTLLIKYYRGIGNCDFLLIFAWNRCPLLTSSNMTVKCMLTKLVGFSLILFRTCTHRTALQINIRPIAYDTARITNSNTFQNAWKRKGWWLGSSFFLILKNILTIPLVINFRARKRVFWNKNCKLYFNS